LKGYLFDTCVVRRWYGKSAAVAASVKAIPDDDLIYISAITIGEIEYAHTNIASQPEEQAKFREWIAKTFEIPELVVSKDTGWEYAAFRRMLFSKFDRKGKYAENCEDCLGSKVGVDENDLWLVAQAKERNLTFVTIDGMSHIKEVVGDLVAIEPWSDV